MPKWTQYILRTGQSSKGTIHTPCQASIVKDDPVGFVNTAFNVNWFKININTC